MLLDMLRDVINHPQTITEHISKVYDGYCAMSTQDKILSGVMVVAGVAALVLLPSDRYPEE